MFIDQAEITIKAGSGGNGALAFRREAFIPKGGPSGGDGGNGGDVIFVGDPGQTNLLDFTLNTRFFAENGQPGQNKDMHGRNGEPLRVLVPVGTIVRIKETGDLLADIDSVGKEVVVARGGRGGKGNSRFKTATNQAPREHTPGEKTQEIVVKLELKIVADIGFVGYPNAGKSTLLKDLTDANPKIAAYPFTTLHPVIGVMEYPDFHRITIADIPGLVDGAHDNVGLGHEFLRHIERTRMLVYVLDMAGTDGRNPVDDLKALKKELDLYSKGLSKRAGLIIANKMDVPESKENLKALVKSVRKRLPIFPMSAKDDPDFNELMDVIRSLTEKKPEPPDATQTVRVKPGRNALQKKRVQKKPKEFDDGVEVVYAP